MKAVIVDDEHYALLRLKMELENIGGIEVAGMYKSGEQMLEELDGINPDVIFLDIEMPDINGLELAGRIMDKNSSANIVFVTAFNKYAVEAFDLNALDYIVKPVNRERLIKTVGRLQPGASTTDCGDKKPYIRCFRRFSIILENKELSLEWRTSKALELMAYLIYEKGIYVSKEKISEVLWPDLSDDKGVSKLYLAYYYIKKQEKLTGISFPVESERGRMRICLDKIDCDIIKFDELIGKCEKIYKDNVVLAEKAVSLYIGGLFEDNYFEWGVIEQQKYEIAYEELLHQLIKHHKDCNNKEKCKFYNLKLKKLYEDA